MKLLFGAAVAAMLIATPALAQTPPSSASNCPQAGEPPTLPDGATADRNEVEAANERYTTWAQGVSESLTCMRAEAEALHQQWQARVSAHNEAAETLRATTASWEAEVQEFNERNPRRTGTTRQPTN